MIWEMSNKFDGTCCVSSLAQDALQEVVSGLVRDLHDQPLVLRNI